MHKTTYKQSPNRKGTNTEITAFMPFYYVPKLGTLFVFILYTLLVLIEQNPPLFEEEKLILQ